MLRQLIGWITAGALCLGLFIAAILLVYWFLKATFPWGLMVFLCAAMGYELNRDGAAIKVTIQRQKDDETLDS